jgi:hypothetical protein
VVSPGGRTLSGQPIGAGAPAVAIVPEPAAPDAPAAVWPPPLPAADTPALPEAAPAVLLEPLTPALRTTDPAPARPGDPASARPLGVVLTEPPAADGGGVETLPPEAAFVTGACVVAGGCARSSAHAVTKTSNHRLSCKETRDAACSGTAAYCSTLRFFLISRWFFFSPIG